jgi:hypothetical protein
MAPVLLALRMLVRVAIDLAGRRLQDLGADPLRQTKHVDGAVHARLRGLHGVVLVVDRRSRAGEIVDFVDLDIERKGNVVADRLEVGMTQQVGNVAPGPSEIVVNAYHFVAGGDEPITQMAAKKAGAAGHEDPRWCKRHSGHRSFSRSPQSTSER